jgi:hypothetical protein
MVSAPAEKAALTRDANPYPVDAPMTNTLLGFRSLSIFDLDAISA